MTRLNQGGWKLLDLSAMLLTFFTVLKGAYHLLYLLDQPVVEWWEVLIELLPALLCLMMCAAVLKPKQAVWSNGMLAVAGVMALVGTVMLMKHARESGSWHIVIPADDDILTMIQYRQAYTDMVYDALGTLGYAAQALFLPLLVSASLTGGVYRQAYGKENGLGGFARKCIAGAVLCFVLGAVLNQMFCTFPMVFSAQLVLIPALAIATMLTCRRYRSAASDEAEEEETTET